METVFPVFFFDGECQSNIGNVAVYPSMDYKTLQSILSHRIGISPHQFSVYLANFKTSGKIPVAKANLAAISREKDRYFLVALRRSRDSRSRRQRRTTEKPAATANAKVMLLKRNSASDVNKVGTINDNPSRGVNRGVLVCEDCVRAKETGRDVGFHWCVYDAVTFGFRSPAGPIARPVKSSYM